MHNTIKEWAEQDRPREKLLYKGSQDLTDAELLAILLGSGSKNETALDLARRLLADSTSLDHMGHWDVSQFLVYKGIGHAKAVTILAALEIGRRRQLRSKKMREQIVSADAAYKVLGPLLADLDHEEFWVAILNTKLELITKEKIAKGGMNQILVDPKIVFRRALLNNARSIILYHNHPSGSCQPSRQDIDLTKKFAAAGKILDINVNDHIIVGDKEYYSFADDYPGFDTF